MRLELKKLKRTDCGRPGKAAPAQAGFTLVEVVISLALAALLIGGIVYGYIFSSKQAEWTGYSFAAQALALQRLEQTRAASWDPLSFPLIDQLQSTNFPAEVDVLDLPRTGTNIVYATNFTTITMASTNPPLKMIRVDCVWPFLNRGVFTNTVVTLRAPDI